VATGKSGVVIATEKEVQKAETARRHWRQCGETVEAQIDLRVGDLLETLRRDVPEVDLLLLDSEFSDDPPCMSDSRNCLTMCAVWSVLALPTLKTVLPRLRHGAVVLTDNTISAARGYADLLAYLRAPENGFHNITLPYTNGFEMSVYLPRG
jgi:predicted O-methyltransferase YrrM